MVFNNFLLKYYEFYRKIARVKNCVFSSHKVLRIFSEFFSVFSHVDKNSCQYIKKCNTKMLIKNSKKIFRALWKENNFVSCYFSVKLIVFE